MAISRIIFIDRHHIFYSGYIKNLAAAYLTLFYCVILQQRTVRKNHGEMGLVDYSFPQSIPQVINS